MVGINPNPERMPEERRPNAPCLIARVSRPDPMIALLAAVPEETTLIREAIEGSTEETTNGVTL